MEGFLTNEEEAGGLLIISPIGSGKTTFCNLAFKLFDIKVFEPNTENHKDLVEQVDNFVTTCDVSDTLALQKRVVFFDDIDILFAQDRYANTFVQKLVGGAKVVITCSTGEERRVTELKKKCKLLRLELPLLTDIVRVFGPNVREEAERCECNIGHMQRGIDLSLRYFDKNIYQIVENLFENDGISGLEVAISSDPTLISFMMYDNYMVDVAAASVHARISKLFMDTSILEDFAFSISDWNLINIISIIRCQSIRLEDATKKKKEIQYTQITSRAAQHYSVNKKMNSLALYTYENIALLSEAMYAQKLKPNLKTNIGTVCNAYIFNFSKSVT